MLRKLHSSAGPGRGLSSPARAARGLSGKHLLAAALSLGFTAMLIPALAAAEADLKMFRACQDGKTEVLMKRLARGTDINLAASNGATCLTVALQAGHSETARFALEQGADPNVEVVDSRSRAAETPLTIAAALGSAEIVQLLIDRGAAVSSGDGVSLSVLRAAYDGHAEIIRILAEAGANVNGHANFSGRTKEKDAAEEGKILPFSHEGEYSVAYFDFTPLMLAAMQGHMDAVKVLVASGADLSARNARARVAWQVASDETIAKMLFVEAPAHVGRFTSMTLAADGLPVVSYYDVTNGDLKVAKCGDPACSKGRATVSTVDGDGQVGMFTSMTLGVDGLPVISYYDETRDELKVAKCNDAACSGGDETISTVDSDGQVGMFTSMTLGADGLPVISYFAWGRGDLKVAKCNDPACSGGDETISTVDSDGKVGRFSSVTLGSDGRPLVSYRDETKGELKVAKCNDPACSGGDETVSTVTRTSKSVGWTSMTVGSDGLPVISYPDDGELKVAKCNDVACSGNDETISTLEGGKNSSASITMGPDGLPVVSYFDGTEHELKVAKCNDPACSGGDEAVSTVDRSGNVGSFSAIAVGADGLPVISYCDFDNGALKVAACNDPACSGGDEAIATVDGGGAG